MIFQRLKKTLIRQAKASISDFHAKDTEMRWYTFQSKLAHQKKSPIPNRQWCLLFLKAWHLHYFQTCTHSSLVYIACKYFYRMYKEMPQILKSSYGLPPSCRLACHFESWDTVLTIQFKIQAFNCIFLQPIMH